MAVKIALLHISSPFITVHQMNRRASTPIPVYLTEGQFAKDPRLELMTRTAINNGQLLGSDQVKDRHFLTPHGEYEFTIPNEWWHFAEASCINADSENYYPYTLNAQGVKVISLRDIEPPKRDKGIAPFKKYKLVPVLLAFHSPECELPPIEVTEIQSSKYKYRVINGYHRYYASVAVGYGNVPVILCVSS